MTETNSQYLTCDFLFDFNIIICFRVRAKHFFLSYCSFGSVTVGLFVRRHVNMPVNMLIYCFMKCIYSFKGNSAFQHKVACISVEFEEEEVFAFRF